MKRAALLVVVLSLTVAVSASAAEVRTARGTVVALTEKTIGVKDAKGIVTTCARGERSPSLARVAVGDRVEVACARAGARLVLVKLRKSTTATFNEGEPVTFGGVVSKLTDDSVSVRDGNRELTCALVQNSPSVADLKVGRRAKVQCVNGALTRLVVTATVDAPAPTVRTAAGNITALTDGAISIHNDENGGFDLTCTLGTGSPSLGEYRVGDRVGLACANGVLAKIVKIR